MRAQRILLVEDDGDVADVLCGFITEILERECLHARSADEALEVIGHMDVHLVLSDILMPGHSGFWLLDVMHQEHPDIPMLLMSGWYNEAERAKHVQPRLPVLCKPFGSQQMAHAIEQAERLIETAANVGRAVSDLARDGSK